MKPPQTSHLAKAEFAQPLCTAIQIALVNLLASVGVKPASVVGHSSGEIAAAYAAEALTAAEAIIIAYYRGQVTKSQTRLGGMAAIGLGKSEVTDYLKSQVVIACENSPESVTISGDADQVDAIVAEIKSDHPDILARRLRVEMAYHSGKTPRSNVVQTLIEEDHMKLVGEEYRKLLETKVKSKAPAIPFYSSVTGKLITQAEEHLGPKYWQDNMECPVQFFSAVKALIQFQQQHHIFLEIGPHSALSGPLRQIQKFLSSAYPYVPTLVRSQCGKESLLSTFGQLFLNGCKIDLGRAIPLGVVLTDLPTYPWHHEGKYWHESRLSSDWRFRKHSHHDVLGSRVTESTDLEPTWRNLIYLEDVPWVRDHKIYDDVVFPIAGYIAMAGEAVRQISGDGKGFSLKQVVVSAAMVMHETQPTEVITSFRPYKYTDMLDSSWFEFVVASYNGTAWTKHCVGQVRSNTKELTAACTEQLPRSVSAAAWYTTMSKIGLNFGPSFQGLADITAATTENSAVATTRNRIGAHDSDYHLHPTTIDNCLQLLGVAVSRGLSRKISNVYVPTSVDEIDVFGASSDILVKATASRTLKGVLLGNVLGLAAGNLVLRVRGVRLSPLETISESSDPHAAAQLVWCPDIDFLDANDLIRPSVDLKKHATNVETLALLCILESNSRTSGMNVTSNHLEKYKAWLSRQIERAKKGDYKFVEDSVQLVNTDSQNRVDLIQSMGNTLLSTSYASSAAAILKILDNSVSIISGEVESLEVLLEDNTLTNLYTHNFHLDGYLRLLGHGKPCMRVLEIGAGTGGITEKILEGLVSADGLRTYSSYTYTDISAGFFVAAKERFKEASSVEFAVLDISRDPLQQGFEAGSYDLVIAANVIHATPSLKESLQNVRVLLAPGGRLLLQELCPSSRWINYVMGVLSGWWLGAPDERPDEPYVSPARWEKELLAAGFSGAESVTYDEEAPYHLNAVIVARPQVVDLQAKSLTLLCLNESEDLTGEIAAQFQRHGYKVDMCTLYQRPPPDQDIVALLDLNGPFLDQITAEQFETLQNFLHGLVSAGVLWVTRNAQVSCEDPRYAQILGLARTIRSEMSLDFATLEMSRYDLTSGKFLMDVFERFHGRIKGGNIGPDFEYVVFNDQIHTGRYHPQSIMKQIRSHSDSDTVVSLGIGKYGMLQTLQWVKQEPESLGDEEVEIDMKAVGMNFKVCQGKASISTVLTTSGCAHRHGNRRIREERLRS